jgi:hypothetical protein
MSTKQDRASAARVALAVALPMALLAGAGSLWLSGAVGRSGPAGGTAAGSPTLGVRPGATSAVAVPAAPLSPRAAAVCRAVLALLPPGLRDAPRRPVTEGVEQNAAYGDPPLTFACGAPAASVPPEGEVAVLSGVCWYALRASADTTVWTTLDREVPVRVTVPSAYESPGQWVILFSAALSARNPALPDPPRGCLS